MKYKFYIDYSDGYEEIIPDSIEPFSIVREQTSSSKALSQFFYRISWGKIKLSNKPFLYSKSNATKDKIFSTIESLDSSKKIFVKVETPKMTIIGYFGKNDCVLDYDNFSLTVEPTSLDQYTPFFENAEVDVDLSSFVYDGISISVPLKPNYLVTIGDWPTKEGSFASQTPITPRNLIKESDYTNNGGTLLYFDGEAPKDELFADSYYGFSTIHKVWSDEYTPIDDVPVATNSLADRIQILGQEPSDDNTSGNYGPMLDIRYGDYELSRFRIYEGTRTGGLSGRRWRQLYCETWFSREEVIKEDVVDTSNNYGYQSPVGNGWHMRKQVINKGAYCHIWTRKPFNGAYSNNWQIQPTVINDSSSNYNYSWNKYTETKLIYEDENLNSVKIESSIKLKDLIQYIIRNSNSELSLIEVKSSFFFNDYEDTLPALKNMSGCNYVTGSKNYLNNTRVFFTKDLVSTDLNSKKENVKFSANTILGELNKAFGNTLGFFITGNIFRIEHLKFLEFIESPTDITSEPLLDYTSKFEYDKSKSFSIVNYKSINSGFIDFSDNNIVFPQLPSNSRNNSLKEEIETSVLSTDVRYCIQNPNDLDNGIILVALDSSNIVMNKVGLLSKSMETNGYLAISNILIDFCTYEGIWLDGKINNANAKFKNTIRNKVGQEIMLKGNKQGLFFKTKDGVGIIDSGTIDIEREYTKIKLRYRHDSSQLGETFKLLISSSTLANIDNY